MQAALLQQEYAFCQFGHAGSVVRGKDDRAALLGKFADKLTQPVLSLGIQPDERLIKQDEVWIVHEGRGP